MTVVEQIAIADALRREADLLEDVANDPGHRHLMFWQTDQCLVAPAKMARKPGYRGVCDGLERDGWPVHLRNTGGDVTPQGPGIVNVTLVYALPAGPPDIAATFDRLCGPIEAALGKGASRGGIPGAFCDGAHNVQIDGAKFAGTAQRYRRCHKDRDRFAVLAHALMLIAPVEAAQITAINRFLHALGEPRVIRRDAHGSLPTGLCLDDFLARLRAAYDGRYPSKAPV